MPKRINGKIKNIREGNNDIKRGGPTEPLLFDDFITPPFYGTGEILTWEADSLINGINKALLFSDCWNKTDTDKEVEALYSTLINEILKNELLNARGFYAYYPVITDNELLILLSPGDYHTEIASLRFPRIKEKDNRSYAAFFRPEGDILPIQAATLGNKLSDTCDHLLRKEGVRGHYLFQLGTYLTDIITEKLTIEIQRGLGLHKNQGLRCCFGDSGMPEKEKNQDLIELLCADDRLGITLDKDFQLQPEYSSLALFIHHPEVNNF